jgi:hypothetical protein
MQKLFWLVLVSLAGFTTGSRAAEEYVIHPRETPTLQAAGFTGGGTNLFPRIQGIYNGLAMPTNDFVAEYSGFFELTVDWDRDFRGAMNIGGRRYPLRGRFDQQGRGGVTIYRRDWDDCHCSYDLRLIWIVDFELIQGTDEIVGIADNVRHGWSTELFGFRGQGILDGLSIDEGRYTVRLPSGTNATVAPIGEGYGVMKVTSRARGTMYGALADGTGYSRTAVISTNGYWPFYLPLNEGQGAMIGWLRFSTEEFSDVAGDLFWVRPARESRRLYPNGYSGNVAASGSRYSSTNFATFALNWIDGFFYIDGGNLLFPAENSIVLLPRGKLGDLGGHIANLSFSLSRSSGIFRGRFTHPDNGRRTSYAGVIDQIAGIGGGYFLGIDQGGWVRLEPALAPAATAEQ